MPDFYVPAVFRTGERFVLPENVGRHIRVLRLREGDRVVLFDGRGVRASAVLCTLGRRETVVEIGGVETAAADGLEIVLLQGVSAAERMDWTVQKATELGVGRIIPFVARRSVLRLQGERAEKKVQRWREIAVSACEQCKRSRLPEIDGGMPDLAEALTRLPPTGQRLLLSPHRAGRMADLPAPTTGVAVLVGPEGGLTEEEEVLALAQGFAPVLLGPRVLRTETAAVAALTAVQVLWGDF